MIKLQILNAFFFAFHTALMLFNLLGWLFPRTRKLHLLCLGLTAFSWFVLGWWYGWGYCFCTDWHWQVRAALGLPNPSASYVHFLIVLLTPWNPASAWADAIALGGFIIGLAGAAGVRLRKRKAGAR